MNFDYDPSKYSTPWWHAMIKGMRKKIPDFKTDLEAIHWAQRHTNTGFDHRYQLRHRPQLWTHNVKELLNYHFPDYDYRLTDAPDSLYVENGESGIFLAWHLYQILSIDKHLKITPETKVLEVGGGYGALCRLMLLKYPGIRYTIIDFPECLYFVKAYLRHNNLWKGKNVSLCPIYNSPRKNDVAVNCGSFQEMPQYMLHHFFQNVFPHCGIKKVYSLNYADHANGFQQHARVTTPENYTLVHENDFHPILFISTAGTSWSEKVFAYEPHST